MGNRDALLYRSAKPVDIIVSSLMTHHLEDDQIVTMLKWMETTARIGWFINDLDRSEVSAGSSDGSDVAWDCTPLYAMMDQCPSVGHFATKTGSDYCMQQASCPRQ